MKSFVWGILLCCLAGVLSAGPLVLDDQSREIPLGRYADVYLDELGTYSREQVEEFRLLHPANEDALNFAYSLGRVWLRFEIENPSASAKSRVLELRYNLLDEIRLYTPQPDGSYRMSESGRAHRLPSDRHASRFFTFRLDIPPQSRQVYFLSVRSADSLALPLFVTTPEAQQRGLLRDSILLTLFFGLVLANVLFASFMAIVMKDWKMFYYVGFLVSYPFFIFMLIEGGVRSVFGVNSLFWNRDALALALSFSMICIILFARDFLQFRERMPLAYRLSYPVILMMSVGIVLALFGSHFYAITYATLACMVLAGYLGFSTLFCALEGHREAWMLLLAWAAGLVGALVYGLKVWGLLPVNGFTTYAWLVGTAVEATLFSYSIAASIVLERKQRMQAQVMLTQREHDLRLTQEELLRTETAAKHALEERVSERTRDLSLLLSQLEKENRNLAELSINDGLTRVRNRRFFDDIFPQLWKEAVDAKSSLAMVLVDVDHFKNVNDTYGHLMGDRCLVVVASVLKKIASRPMDVVCRYGGEEFIVLLPDTTLEAAMKVAERMRQQIEGTIIDLDTRALSVTASFGVAGGVLAAHMDRVQMLSRCDEALYRAKEGGRNRVCLAEPDEV